MHHKHVSDYKCKWKTIPESATKSSTSRPLDWNRDINWSPSRFDAGMFPKPFDAREVLLSLRPKEICHSGPPNYMYM